MRASARKRSRSRRLLRRLRNTALLLLGATTGVVLLYRFVPPPASGLMVERRMQSWFVEGAYRPRYDWEPLENIAPVMGVAVIAAEDQNFAEHFGFD